MRCNRAGTIALINHPKYSQNNDLLTDAARIAEGEIQRHFEFAIIVDLPVALAKSVMEAHIPQLLKTQRANGLWKKEKFGGWCQSNITQGLAYKRWVGIKKT